MCSNFKISWQTSLALTLLAAVMIFSTVTDVPVKTVYPYALSVGLVAWRHGLMPGFLFSALATLVALLSDAFPTHPTSAGQEAVEGLITYAQLSFVCLCVCLVKRARSLNTPD